jgi:hypothetical protein
MQILTRILSLLALIAVWAIPAHALSFDDLRQVISEAIGAPGREEGDFTIFMDQEISPDVSILMGCSAGKVDGLGDDIRTSLTGVISAIPTPFPWNFARNEMKRRIERGDLTIDEGEGFCFAVAHKSLSLKRVKNLKNGSIYVTTWKDGKIVEQATDLFFCRRLSRNLACFEVVELPSGHEGGIDGVSGCFHTEINGVLKSVSMGRGKTIPALVSNTFKAEASVSDKSCIERGLGTDE